MEPVEKKEPERIVTEGKTADEIIDQEVAAITKQWDDELIMV